MENQNKRDVRRAATIKDTADVLGVSPSLVQKSLAGTRDNEKVVAVYMEIAERKNELLEQVKLLVPFI